MFRALLLATALAAAVGPAHAAARAEAATRLSPRVADTVMVADNGCAGAAQAVAAQLGGQVIGVQVVGSGGNQQCRVTVLIPDPTGNNPPRRQTVTVAAQ